MVAPCLRCSLAQVENAPPGVFLTAIRSRSSCTAEQIEYERRTCSPPMSARSVRCWPCTKRNASPSAGGTSKVSVTASRVSRATEAMVRAWNLLIDLEPYRALTDHHPFRRSRENEPEGRSFEERPSGNPVSFLRTPLDPRFRGDDKSDGRWRGQS